MSENIIWQPTPKQAEFLVARRERFCMAVRQAEEKATACLWRQSVKPATCSIVL